MSSSTSPRPERLEAERHRPGSGVARRAPGGRCRAAGSTRPRRAARRARSDRATSPRPTGCRRRRRPAVASAAACSSVLRKAQAISSADVVAASLSPSSERITAAAVLVRGQHVELLQHLDDRPVRDSLAVGEAATAHDGRLAPSPTTSATSRDLPTPASPTTVTSSQHRVAIECAPPTPRSSASSRLTTDEPRPVPALPARALARAGRRGRAADLPFSTSGSTGSVSTVSRTSASVGCSDQHLARLRRLLQPWQRR